MARITVATNYAYKDKTGKAVIETNWHSIVAREGKYVKDLEKLKKGIKYMCKDVFAIRKYRVMTVARECLPTLWPIVLW